MELTSAGETLLDRLRHVLPSVGQAIADTKEVGKGLAGSVSIGFVGSVAYDFLPRVIKAAESRFPGVHLVLLQMTTDAQIEALANRKIHLALSRSHVPVAEFDQLRLSSEPFLAAVPQSSRLAKMRAVDLRLFDKQRFVT